MACRVLFLPSFPASLTLSPILNTGRGGLLLLAAPRPTRTRRCNPDRNYYESRLRRQVTHRRQRSKGCRFLRNEIVTQAQKNIPRKFGIEILEINSDHELSTNNYELVHYPILIYFWHTLPIFKKNQKPSSPSTMSSPWNSPDHYPPGVRGRLNLQLQKAGPEPHRRVITDSHASVKSIHKYQGVPHEKLKLIYLAADEKFKPIKAKNKYKLPAKFVLYVGDIDGNKKYTQFSQSL